MNYIAYILNNYYPAVPAQPASLTDVNDRAAAVQSAIWYFPDNYVLPPGHALFAATSAIVADALANGALTPEPVLPSLSFSGPAAGPAGQVLGAYTFVAEPVTQGALTYAAGELFRD